MKTLSLLFFSLFIISNSVVSSIAQTQQDIVITGATITPVAQSLGYSIHLYGPNTSVVIKTNWGFHQDGSLGIPQNVVFGLHGIFSDVDLRWAGPVTINSVTYSQAYLGGYLESLSNSFYIRRTVFAQAKRNIIRQQPTIFRGNIALYQDPGRSIPIITIPVDIMCTAYIFLEAYCDGIPCYYTTTPPLYPVRYYYYRSNVSCGQNQNENSAEDYQ